MVDNKNDIVYSGNEIIIKGTYVMQMKEKIGSGSFGEIYKGYNSKTQEPLAFKLELSTTKTPQLSQESKILKILQGIIGFTNVYYYSPLGDDVVMVIDLLGPNLEELLKKCDSKRFSLKTTLMLADQMLTRLNAIHDKDFIHRDLKPENFLIGLTNKENLIYLIDFGLSRKFRDPKTNEHIPYKEGKSILGTVRYVSIYTHFGIEQSRRDDIESLGYILVYFAKGILPWQGQKTKTKKDKYKIIMDKKLEYKPELLCHGLPDEFRQYFEYIRGVQFSEKPDYVFLKGLFSKVMHKLNMDNDSIFEWCKMTHIEYGPGDNYVPRYDMAKILDRLDKLKNDNKDKCILLD